MHKMKVFFLKAKTRNEKKKHFLKKFTFVFLQEFISMIYFYILSNFVEKMTIELLIFCS